MSESKRQQQRVEVGLKVNLKYPDRDSFVERFSINVSRTGLFVRAKDPLPVGSRVRFEYRIADNTRMLRGVGLVRWSRGVEDSSDEKPPGMGIEFVDLDPQSEELITHIVATKGDGVRAPRRQSAQASGELDVAAPPRQQPSLPQVGSASGDDTALDAIDALGGLDEPPADAEAPPSTDDELDALLNSELPAPIQTVQTADVPLVSDPLEPDDDEDGAEFVSEAPSSRVDLAADRLVMDLGGTDLLTALVTHEDGRVDRFNEHNVPIRVDSSGSLVKSGGEWLPSLLAWFEPAGAAPRARAMGNRLGWSIERASDGLAVRVGSEPVLIRDVLKHTLEEATRPHREQNSEIKETVVVVPAVTSSASRRLVTQMLNDLGVDAPTLVSDAEAVLGSVGLDLEFGEQAVVVQVTLFETRVTLVEGPDQVRGFRSAIDAGLWEGDHTLSREASVALLREHGIDVNDDEDLQSALRDQMQRLRRQHVGDGPWSINIAGATVEASAQDVASWCTRLSERIALLTHGVLTEHEVLTDDLEALVLITDEMPWPGLIETVEELLDVSPILPDAGPWVRIDGASKAR